MVILMVLVFEKESLLQSYGEGVMAIAVSY